MGGRGCLKFNSRVVCVLAVGLLPPETAVVEHHFLAADVVAEPETAKREPPLAITKLYIHELLDPVGPAPVLGIGPENIEGSFLERSDLWVGLQEAPEQSLKTGGRADRKRGCHALKRRFLLFNAA